MGKYLDFYKRCLKVGRMPNRGLCNCRAINKSDLKLFIPSYEDIPNIIVCEGYWAFDGEAFFGAFSFSERCFAFSELRQTIVLFMAAMNDELDKPKKRKK